ncbi:hypothetical protein pb186bvf_010533 [Paramecium bursaria]
MIHLVWELYDGQTHKDECAEVLSTAYSYNNPFMAPLKLNKQDLKQDFLLQLDSKIFKWIFIFFDGELYHQGIKEIVGVTCAGEMLDFQTPHELNESQNFDMVPSPQLVRTYMRYKTLKPFWEKMQNIQKNEYFYVGNTGITPKYMGRGIVSYYMVLEIISYLKYQGYKYAVSNAINSIAKRFIGRLSNVLQEKVTLEEMQVVSDKSEPFKNTGLTQVLFVGEVQDGINLCNQILGKRQPRLKELNFKNQTITCFRNAAIEYPTIIIIYFNCCQSQLSNNLIEIAAFL